MTFIHPALLAGLLLAGLPILLHLIMRQRPKSLQFPAFRFLAQKATANRRRMRLRHLLLLLLRIGLVALMCLALARPRISSERLSLFGDGPVSAIVIIDTSPSMGYVVGGQSRHDEAKARALELIGALPSGSRLAVIECRDASGAWLPTLELAREKVAASEITPSVATVTEMISASYRLFDEQSKQATDADEVHPRILYIFSDRAPASWDITRAAELAAASEQLGQPMVHHFYFDVGVEKPVDVALTELRLLKPAFEQNKPVRLAANVMSTGTDVEAQVNFRVEVSPDTDSKAVKLNSGQTKEVSFERRKLALGLHRAEFHLAADDALPFNNTLFATVDVQSSKPVLILSDHAADAKTLSAAIRSNFPNEIKTTDDPAVRAVTATDLGKYQAVCLLSVAAPSRSGLWEKLEKYVASGGALAIFPGGDEMIASDYANRAIMPGEFQEVIKDDAGATWKPGPYQHPVAAPFHDYAPSLEDHPPRAFRSWSVTPKKDSVAVVNYSDPANRPAILASAPGPSQQAGRVMLMTTPFDNREDNRGQPWSDYFVDNWFGLVLSNHVLQYLVGESELESRNFVSGGPAVIRFPANMKQQSFTLIGPGISGLDAIVARPATGGELRMMQARLPGHYTVTTLDRSWSTGFSVNWPAEESQLLPRVPADTIAVVCGANSIVMPGQATTLADKLDQQYRQPLELFPWLMLALLLLFIAENLMANRFYRRDGSDNGRDAANAAGL